MSVKRDNIVLVPLPFTSGTGGKVRPALVVQSDLNNHRLTNTIVAMIAKTTHRAAWEPTQLLIDLNDAGRPTVGLAAYVRGEVRAPGHTRPATHPPRHW